MENPNASTVMKFIFDAGVKTREINIIYTFAIFQKKSDRENLLLIGSAFGIFLNSTKYIITANHVINEELFKNGMVYIVHKSGFCAKLNIVVNTPLNSEIDDFWISQVQDEVSLPDTYFAKIPQSSLLNIISNENTSTLGISIGYPASRNLRYLQPDKTLKLTYLGNTGLIFEENTHPNLYSNLTANKYILTEYSRTEALSQEGNPITPIKMNGMSGGPLFQINLTPDSFHHKIYYTYTPPIGILLERNERNNPPYTKYIKLSYVISKLTCQST